METNPNLIFFERCLRECDGEFKDCFKDIIKEAGGDIQKAVTLIIQSNEKEIIKTQAYAIASRRLNPDEKHRFRVRAMLGKNCKTTADAGSLKIGNDQFTINIPNGSKNNSTHYGILEQKDFNSDMMSFFTSVKGTFNIYECDYGDRVVETISGCFGIYYCDGIIVFEKWQG